MIKIYASEVSSCLEMNKYKKIDQIIHTIWKRTNNRSYREALERNNKIQEIQETEQMEQILLTENEKSINELINDYNVDTFKSKLTNYFSDIPEEDRNKMISYIFTERGKKMESISLDKLEESLNIKITARNDKFYKQYITFDENEENKKFMIGGKVDGITDDFRLIEIKNRQRMLFSNIPIYEKIQMYIYMFITGITECLFVQCYNNETDTVQLQFDENFWINDIKKPLIIFVQKLNALLNNIDLQDKFITSNSW